MQKIFVFTLLVLVFFIGVIFYKENTKSKSLEVLSINTKSSYWLVLHRKSNIEFLYFGVPAEPQNSQLVKKFKVKTGISGQSPTPLSKLLGREYWIITNKESSEENPETAPYFLTLDIPVTDDYPFGPTPYSECNGECNWQIPGYFGLHGVNGNESRLSNEDPGSSGCIRHSDEDITYLYNLLDPQKGEIRYYIEDI